MHFQKHIESSDAPLVVFCFSSSSSWGVLMFCNSILIKSLDNYSTVQKVFCWRNEDNAKTCVKWLEPLSLSHSGKYMENVSRDMSRDGLISHCQWFSGICACVHSHTTRKYPIKTRDISYDVYNAARTISLNQRTISASARIARSSLISASFQFAHFSSCERWPAFKTTIKTVAR